MKDLPKLNLTEAIGSVTYTQVKRAIVDGDINNLSTIYSFFMRFDTQILSEISKRKNKVIGFPLIIKSDNKNVEEFLQNLVKKTSFLKMVLDMTSAIGYGFSVFEKGFINVNGLLEPNYKFKSHRYFHENSDILYATSMGTKIEINDKFGFWIYYHPVNSGEFFERSLLYHVVSIAVLKFIVIDKNMIYFDNLSVPPIIARTDGASDEESIKDIVDQILSLRSAGVGVFSKEDVIELLNANASKADFLEFIRYCDECISKATTGQVLAGNNVTNGTQALGAIHNEIRNDIAQYDAKLLESGIYELLKESVNINFGEVEFDITIDTNTEKEEATQILVHEKISAMGYDIPSKFLEEIYKIPGLKKKDVLSFEPNFKMKNSFDNKPLDKFDNFLESNNFKEPLKGIENSIKEHLNTWLNECETYEEAFNKLYKIYDNVPLDKLEEVMINAIANANVIGLDDD